MSIDLFQSSSFFVLFFVLLLLGDCWRVEQHEAHADDDALEAEADAPPAWWKGPRRRPSNPHRAATGRPGPRNPQGGRRLHRPRPQAPVQTRPQKVKFNLLVRSIRVVGCSSWFKVRCFIPVLGCLRLIRHPSFPALFPHFSRTFPALFP